MAHKSMRFEDAIERLAPMYLKKAEDLLWSVEENYEIVLAHREDAIKGFSLETRIVLFRMN